MADLTCVIVDDEAIARETLSNYLQKYCPEVKIVGTCQNIIEAKQCIEQEQPDMVFLDIEMPFGDGFDLMSQFDSVNFEVIFVTAYSNYAIRALNLSATHYILKPVDIDELIAAVEKVKAKANTGNDTAIQSKILLENLKLANHEHHRIILPQLTGFIVVAVQDILFAQAADNYCEIHLKDGKKHVVSKPLKFYDDLLSDMGFIRIHKSFLINQAEIIEFKKGKTGQVKLSNGQWFDIATSRKKDFLSNFN